MTKIFNGDCLDELKGLPDNSVDSIVTDPPYGLSFMGKQWDYDVPSVEIWKECLRVLKPGGHLLAFGGTRTYHRLVVAIEDAGFEIRDQIQWIYGQGFPKSMDISKAIDKEAGAEREVVGKAVYGDGHVQNSKESMGYGGNEEGADARNVTAPATPEAQKYAGWGTALKPANEPICLARKPLGEKTVAKNVLKHGTGGLNIDATRIGTNGETLSIGSGKIGKNTFGDFAHDNPGEQHAAGRFPANAIFDEDAAAALDEQTGELGGGTGKRTTKKKNSMGFHGGDKAYDDFSHADSGGASRFFYVAKASKSDRGAGNTHPTVKPVKLMEYLVKLVTPEGGTVLDPFMGSGTTGVAALKLGFKFVSVERDEKYYEICEQRIRDTLAARKLAKAALNQSKETA